MNFNWLKRFVSQPEKRMKQLYVAIGIFFVGVLLVYVAASFESQILFYLGSVIMGVGIVIALPAYLAFLYWRITSIRNKN
ncbi:MAG: hypothetical protein HWE27_04380 [Gammaproteobacteria bacterium]|nr:hypothetical protein [Gammaproteobacteria bacterium]